MGVAYFLQLHGGANAQGVHGSTSITQFLSSVMHGQLTLELCIITTNNLKARPLNQLALQSPILQSRSATQTAFALGTVMVRIYQKYC